MDVSVRPASFDEQQIVKNLLQLYLHDFSEFDQVKMDDQGHLDYPYIDHYWRDPGRFPYLIRAKEQLAGFVLIRTSRDPAQGTPINNLAEFFVLRSHRRQGVGRMAANQIWNLFPGAWEVDVLLANKQAYPFWKLVVEGYSSGTYQQVADRNVSRPWIRFTFESKSNLDT